MAAPTGDMLKSQLDGLLLFVQENQQPIVKSPLEKSLPRDGKENLRARAFAAGAAMAIISYAEKNEFNISSDRIKEYSQASLKRDVIDALYESYTYAIDGGTFAVSRGKSRLSDESNVRSHRLYMIDICNGFNVQLAELKLLYSGTKYPDALDAENIGTAIKLAQAVVERL